MQEDSVENQQSDHEKIVTATKRWVESLVIGLNLCPFAKREMVKNRVRFVVTDATTGDSLLICLQAELALLQHNDSIETTLLIHHQALQNFTDYNEFLAEADFLLNTMDLDGIFQIASFHPDYQFAGTDPEDVENYTNRSSYPMLHLLREDSLEKAIDTYPDADQIPERNIARLKEMGLEKVQALLHSCFVR
jgi:hypothetical protein